MRRNGEWRSTKYIVCDDPAFVYYVIPKVGCSSVKTALLPLFGMEDRGAHPADHESGVHALFDRSGYQESKFELMAKRDRYRQHFKFTFVRNPWDRLLSCYYQKLAPGGQGLGREEWGGERLWVGMDLPEFIRAVCRIPDESSNPHFRSQHVTVCSDGPRKELLVDFVAHYERFEEDFALIAKRLGADLRLPRLLASGRPPSYRDSYGSRELARMVGERYRMDAEVFGYSF